MRKPLVLLAPILALALTACSSVPMRSGAPATPNEAGAPAATQGMTTIRVLTVGADPLMDAVISAFQAKYPNYRVERVPLAAGMDRRQVATTMLSQNDVDIVPAIDLQAMVHDNLLLDLDPYISKSRFDLNALGPAVEQMRLSGKLYDLPYGMDAGSMVYNKQMFQAAGVPFPKAGWTWDDFRDAAQQLTSGNGGTKVWGADAASLRGFAQAWLLEKVGTITQADAESPFLTAAPSSLWKCRCGRGSGGRLAGSSAARTTRAASGSGSASCKRPRSGWRRDE